MASEVHGGTTRPIVQADGALTHGHRPEVIVVTASGATGVVDTELPAAAALADGASNPTAPAVGAHQLFYYPADGKWYRAQIGNNQADGLGGSSPLLVLAQLMGSNGTSWDRLRAAASNVDGDDLGSLKRLLTLSTPFLSNGSTFDRFQNNREATLLAAAGRTATTATGDQTAVNHRGAVLFLNVTANPGGGESLTLEVQEKDPVSGGYATVTAFAAVVAANGLFVYTIYPGAAETGAVAGHEVQALPLPRTWRARVVHSAAGAWTYSLGACLVV